MKKIIFLSILFIFSVNISSQTKIKRKDFVGKNYWTKFVIATSGNCRTEITLTDISTSEKICRFDSHIKTDTRIKLIDLFDEKGWAKLIFRNEDQSEFEVFVKNDSKAIFKKSFNFALSSKKISDEEFYPQAGNLKTKYDVIKKLGFPTNIERDGKTEKWIFGADWVYANFYSYDETYIYIENGKVIKINGII